MDFDCVCNTRISMSCGRVGRAESNEQQMMRFILELEVDTFNWLLHQHSTAPQFLGRDPPSVHVAAATGPRTDFIKTVQRAIDSCGYTLDNDDRLHLLYSALCEAAKAPDCRVLVLACRVRVKHRHVHAAFVHSPTMLPAADSSLELLAKYEATDGDCCICLEHLHGADAALRMPCSHVFHGDCIKEWLRASHYCPLCRYEMPTN